MNLRNISNCLLKISTPVIQFSGGWVKELNSRGSLALHMIFYVFLVSDSTAFTMPKMLSLYPGSAVAVERIFLGGQDTISLYHASLQADTICILMLVKKQLHLAHAKANVALGH